MSDIQAYEGSPHSDFDDSTVSANTAVPPLTRYDSWSVPDRSGTKPRLAGYADWSSPEHPEETPPLSRYAGLNPLSRPTTVPPLSRFADMENGDKVIYNSYAGVDIVAQIVLPNEQPVTLGELQTFSYSVHRENTPVRLLGRTNVAGFVRGARTVAGSMIFTVFNNYAFYRLKQFQDAIGQGLYPISDMLPPFDMVLTFANESGAFSKMSIFGVTMVDEGQTMSIDDLITEQTLTYMARGIQPLTGYSL